MLVRTAVAGLACAALVPLSAPPAAAAACADVFPASFTSALARDFPDLRVTAAVDDVRTACWYHLRRDLRLTTASVIKAGILAGALLRAQDAGRGLTRTGASYASPMVRLSHDPGDAAARGDRRRERSGPVREPARRDRRDPLHRRLRGRQHLRARPHPGVAAAAARRGAAAGARAGDRLAGTGSEVRHVSGGNETPLGGQRACSPRLRP